ncbi:hypothetical protein C3L33_11017, partial [Rhododendron williamsianum]
MDLHSGQPHTPLHAVQEKPIQSCLFRINVDFALRMQPTETKYVALEDGRKLCLECLDSAIMDTKQCQPLYLDIQEFYEGLNMKVEQQVPLLLVERQALNEAMDGEKSGHHHMPETRGLCLSEEQTVSTILGRPKIGAGNRVMNMITEPYKLIRRCEVTAILILYGLPRLWNSCMKGTEVFVEHVLSIYIEANMYVQVPQLRYIGSGPALHYEGIQKNSISGSVSLGLLVADWFYPSSRDDARMASTS